METKPYKFVDGQNVGLGERVIDLELLREQVDNFRRIFKGEPTLILQATCGVHTTGDIDAIIFPFRVCFNIFEISNCPCRQLGCNRVRQYLPRSKWALT